MENFLSKVTLYGMREKMVKLLNTILKNLGSADMIPEDDKETNLEPVWEFINSTGFHFKDLLDWENISNESLHNLENDFEKFFSKEGNDCFIGLFKQLETGECYLAIQLNGENCYNWQPVVEQNPAIDWFIDNYEWDNVYETGVFKSCSIFENNEEEVNEWFHCDEEISGLILVHPVHYGVKRMNMLYTEKQKLESERCFILNIIECVEEVAPHKSLLLKKIEGIEYRIAGIEEEMSSIEQFWKELGIESENDRLIWRDEDKVIDTLAPLWVLDLEA